MCFNNIKTANEKLYDLIIDAKSSSSKKRYSDEKLTFSKLTNWRFNELPIQVKERYELGNAYITQDELYFLVLWKLNLGSFKPIAHHIKKNMPEDVIKITNRAFNALLAFFMESKQIKEYVIEDIKLYGELVGGAIEILKELAGVGTATASLVLNCLQGINENLSPPFITEESIMYLFSNENLLKKIDTNFYIKEMLPVYFGLIKDNDLNLNFSTIERGVTSIYHYKLHQSIFSFASPFSEEDWFKFSPSESVKSYQKEFEDQSIPTGFKMRMNAEAMAARATTQNNSAPESNSSWIEQALTTNNSTIGISKSTTSQPSTKSDMKTQIKVLSGVNALTELSVTTAQRVFSVQQKLESLEDKIEDCVAENQKLFVKVDQLEAIVRVQNQKILDILGGLEDMVAENFRPVAHYNIEDLNEGLIEAINKVFNAMIGLFNNPKQLQNYAKIVGEAIEILKILTGISESVWSKFSLSDTIKFFKDEFERSPIRNGLTTKGEAVPMAKKVDELTIQPKTNVADHSKPANTNTQAIKQKPAVQTNSLVEPSKSNINLVGSFLHIVEQEVTAISNILKPTKAKKPKSMIADPQTNIMTGINTLSELAVNHDQNIESLMQKFEKFENKYEEINNQHIDNNKPL